MKNKFKPNQNEQLFLLPPSVDDFIPESHLARLINEVVENFDTSFIESKYSALGQKSYHPKSLIKLWIYGYATGTFSGRKIAAQCESDTAYMFLASMYKPDFRTINDFRKDNLEAFSKYFIHVLSICRRLNMGHLGTIAIDGTKIRANASVKKTKDKEHYRQWLQRTENELSQLHKKADAINDEEEKQLGETRGDELPKEIRKKERLKEKIQQVMEQMEEEEKINLTDSDAKLMKSKGTVDCHYNCQGATSMDGVIVSAYVTAAANDREQLMNVIEQAQETGNDKVENILADSGYCSFDVYEKLQHKNITAYMPDQEFKNKDQRKQSPFHHSRFTYDELSDRYSCPQKNELVFSKVHIHKKHKQQYRIYKGIQCQSCPVRIDCTRFSSRTIQRELREHLREQARSRLSTAEGKKMYRQRMYTIEPIWANIKFNRKFKMFSLRGVKKADAEFKLMCSAMNIVKLHRKLENDRAA